MRLFLPLLVCILLASCENDKPDYQKLIQGNWECQYIDEENDTLLVNLYFSDSICHFLRDMKNTNYFEIEDDTILLTTWNKYAIDHGDVKNKLKIIRVQENTLEIASLAGMLNKRKGILATDILKFRRIKKKNNYQIKRISFCSSGCYGPCPSFKMEIDKNLYIKFQGISNTINEGFSDGKSSSEFWKLMIDKAEYIDFQHWKENYEAGWTDDQTCTLVFETNKGIYKVSIYREDKEPRAIRNIIDYIFSNYEHFDLRKTESSKIKFHHDGILKQMGVLPEMKTLQFIPPAR